MIPETEAGTILASYYISMAAMLDAGCLTNSLRLETVSFVFLSLCIKSFCAICFLTEEGREAKQTKGWSERKYVNSLNI